MLQKPLYLATSPHTTSFVVLKYIIIASLFLYRKAKRLDRLRKTNEVSVIILSYILESGAQEQCTMENCFVKNAYFEFNNLAI